MTDSNENRRGTAGPDGKPWKKDTKNVPPLVWIVIAALVLIVAVTVFYGRGLMRTPNGGEMPIAGSDSNTLPPQPAGDPLAPPQSPTTGPAASEG